MTLFFVAQAINSTPVAGSENKTVANTCSVPAEYVKLTAPDLNSMPLRTDARSPSNRIFSDASTKPPSSVVGSR